MFLLSTKEMSNLIAILLLCFKTVYCYNYSYQKLYDILLPQERPLVTAEYANFSNFDIRILTNNPPKILENETSYTNSQVIEALYKKYYYFLDGTPYILDFPNPDVYTVSIKINPCEGLDVEECITRNESYIAHDVVNVTAGPDMLIAWRITNYVITCGPEFANSPECGTYMEIHMPMNPNVIEDEKIEKNRVDTYSYTFLSTKKLCAGSYEVA